MNLLFTSVGRRGYLLRYFKEALGNRGFIHAGNSDDRASAFLEADHTVVTPGIHDPDYIDFLLRYCMDHKIRAVVPLFDIDIPVLASSAERFRAIGVEPVVSSPDVASICNDKWATHEFLLHNNIGSPRTWLDLAEARAALAAGEVSYPVVVKPRWGMGSIAVHMAYNALELEVFHVRVQREVEASYLRYESKATPGSMVLVQERLEGVEHGLDVVNDLKANHVATFIKRKLAMRSGETDAAVTVESFPLLNLGEKLSNLLGHRGNLDVDAFVSGDSIWVLEMNARFGGGYPFSHLAGADVPRAIVAWLDGLDADAAWLKVRLGVEGLKDIRPIVRSW